KHVVGPASGPSWESTPFSFIIRRTEAKSSKKSRPRATFSTAWDAHHSNDGRLSVEKIVFAFLWFPAPAFQTVRATADILRPKGAF
ncbi:hypothetical protein C6Y45_01545, partial [Alkalicoccus saliphilus]